MNPTPFFARTAADGSYRINDVPVGHYELRTWQQRRRYLDHSHKLTISTDATVTHDLELRRH